MSVEYRYRRYRDGDAQAINGLYEAVTGNVRTVEHYEWQWLRAPGGPGDIWLIEAVKEDGSVDLIGHHGIMPVRFSRGDEDLLFGKTENTMLLPEYRRKILYPRYERRFAKHYEERFDALFSTFGHAAAIRQRKAMGYRSEATWRHVRMATSWLSEIRFSFGVLRQKLGLKTGDDAGKPTAGLSAAMRSGHGLRALDDAQAPSDPFFESFWSKCRANYGLTPRRDREDLAWRFWTNPYARHVTLVGDGDSGIRGFVVMRLNTSTPGTASIQDIAADHPGEAALGRLLDATLRWARGNGIRWVDFSTTVEPGGGARPWASLGRRELLLLRVLKRLRPPAAQLMPRKITAKGEDRRVSIDDWYVTPMVLEGR